MKNRRKQLLISLAAVSVLTFSLSGCGKRLSEMTESETQSETQTETAPVTESETQTESESETQKLITSVDYTSKDGTVKITLPDNTWKVIQDTDEMRSFSSGSSAMINIVHASDTSAMNNLTLQTSEENLKASLTRQYSDANGYEVQSFENKTISGVETYRYVVKFNAAARMWAYSVTYGIVAQDQAYVITGTVTDENAALLKSVEESVDSFKVLKDETLSAVTSNVISGTTQQTSETASSDNSSGELATLQEYGTDATLYSNDTVNVRLKPGTDSDVLTTLTPNAKVTVVGETSGWFQVNINGNVGYIRKDFLVYEPSSTEATETDAATNNSGATAAELDTQTQYGSATTLYASSDVNIRQQPGTDSAIIGSFAPGNSVSVVGETDNWFIVSVNGATGYVSKSYLTSDSSVAGNNGSTGGSTGGDTTGGNGSTGGSGDNSGGNSGGETPSGSQTISGTITGSTVDTITIAGNDGHSYTIYTGDANVSTVDGIYDGVSVSVDVDNAQTAADGTLYATNVTGQ